MVRLLKIKYPQLRAVVEIPDDTEIETVNSVSMRADYRKDGQRMMLELEGISKSEEHPEWFDLYAKIVGVFECTPVETAEERKQLHLEGYDLLFPFLQSLFADFTVKAGLPPYHLEKPTIDFHDVIVESQK